MADPAADRLPAAGDPSLTGATPKVPFVALDRQHDALADELRAAYERTVSASGFILGSEVGAFEEEFARFCGATECVGVASGTAAITLALQAAGIGPGDEVVVPAFTYIASVLGVLHAGATPVLCDVERDSALIDPRAAAAAVTERTAAVLAVHLFGQCVDVDALPPSLAVIEDAAQAHGAALRGRRAGSLGTVAAFSFYPSKNLGALGDGGAICTADAAIAARARELRHLGQRVKGEHRVAGWNERLDGLQAAFLREKLPHLDAWNAQRRAHAATYREALADTGVRTPAERVDAHDVYHLFAIRVADRDGVAARLAEAGIDTGVHYDRAVHEHEATSELGARGEFPEAEAWAAEELSLPMSAELRDDEVERVVSALT